MSALAKRLSILSGRLNSYCWWIASAFILVMVFAVALQVVSRYVFHMPPSWTEELARYAMIWAGYLGATVAFYRREDPVLVTPTVNRSRLVTVASSLIRSTAVCIFILPILYWSPVIVQHHLLRETESMGLTSAYVMLVVPVFCVVILVHTLSQLMSTLSESQS
ncbi:MAG: TRAP transporter small permease subunit [Pseudomonadota bacterium]